MQHTLCNVYPLSLLHYLTSLTLSPAFFISLSPVCVYIGSAPTHTHSTTDISRSVPGPPQVIWYIYLSSGRCSSFCWH